MLDRQHMREIWPPARGLDEVARQVARRWDIALGDRFPMARFSFAAPAGEDAVLKVTPPEDDEADHEADALAFWAGHGAVGVLRHDPARRAMLLERIVPDTGAREEDSRQLAVVRALLEGRG